VDEVEHGEKLLDVLQHKMDVIVTADRRAGRLSNSIIQHANVLVGDLYPRANAWVVQNQGNLVFEKLIEETTGLADDMSEWHDTLGVLAVEYDDMKNSVRTLMQALKEG